MSIVPRSAVSAGLAVLCTIVAGCTAMRTSNTSRTAMEQLLISNAVDQSLDKVNFHPFAGQRVFLDESRLECVDKAYVVSSIRHRLFHNGATLVDAADEADVVLEPRSGGVGTDVVDSFIGVPEVAVPGMPIAIPEMHLLKRSSQRATAKIGFLAYAPDSGRTAGSGGISLAQANDSNWFFLGMGPLQNGSVRSEVSRELKVRSPGALPLPTRVAFAPPLETAPEPLVPSPTGPFGESGRVRLTGERSGDDSSGRLRKMDGLSPFPE